MPVLNDVVFCYTKIQTPALKYQSTTDKEYSVDCVVSKAQAKEWNKKFKKQPVKVVDNDDFEKTFKIEPPFAEQDSQYIVKLKKDAAYKDGTPNAHPPKVFQPNTLGKLVDITQDHLVGNGSIGAVSYRESENEYGTFAYLTNIRVDDLIVYDAPDNNELGELASEDDELKTPVKSTKPIAQKKAKEVVEEEEDQPKVEPTKPAAKRGRPAKQAETAVDDNDDPF